MEVWGIIYIQMRKNQKYDLFSTVYYIHYIKRKKF